MRSLKRLAYTFGLVLGLFSVSVAGAVALTYLFTGKLVSIRSDAHGTRIALDTPGALAALLRQQVGRARGMPPAIEIPLDAGEVSLPAPGPALGEATGEGWG
ncbi:MAG TPA: hypothetical protein PKO09_07810 [Anaerolineae bacterium]|nr:hypothetical protein [Anaerolineae bacterium]